MKVYYKIYMLLFVFSFTLFTACKKDNFGYPDAQFYGSIRDVKDSTLIGQDLVNGSVIDAIELGFSTKKSQFWLIKNTGEFRNDLVFSNHYDLSLKNGNFFAVEVDSFFIKKGANQHDFYVTPYIRVINPEIKFNKLTNTIDATFSLQGGASDVNLSTIQLFSFSDIYVGNSVTFGVKGTLHKKVFNKDPINQFETYTLRIVLDENADLFKEGRNYYFRIGALADIPNVGTIRYNYSPLVKISF